MMPRIEAGEEPDHLETQFIPTGPIQEVSVSSGWGKEFLALATEFDAALLDFRESGAICRVQRREQRS
jgi:hypothetical protein